MTSSSDISVCRLDSVRCVPLPLLPLLLLVMYVSQMMWLISVHVESALYVWW